MSRATAQTPARQQNGTAPAERADFLSLLEKSKGEIQKLLPEHVSVDRVMRVARTAYQLDTKIQECDPKSILISVMKACELGLEPGGARKHAWLIPYNRVCTFQLGYLGLLELARRSGQYRVIEGVEVYQNDGFRVVRMPEPKIHHEPTLHGDPGPLVGVYAYAVLNTGATIFEWMPKVEIDKIRSSSKAGNSGPWTKWYGQMALRSVLNRLLKRQPQSIELSQAIDLCNQEFDLENGQPVVRVNSGSRREALAHRIGALPAPEPEFTEGTPGQVTSEADDAEPAGDDTTTDELPLGRQPGEDG